MHERKQVPGVTENIMAWSFLVYFKRQSTSEPRGAFLTLPNVPSVLSRIVGSQHLYKLYSVLVLDFRIPWLVFFGGVDTVIQDQLIMVPPWSFFGVLFVHFYHGNAHN